MLKWHPEMDSENCKITYSHRWLEGNLKTIPVTDIQDLKGGFMIMVDGAMVPCHRIVKIECDNKLVWKKSPKKGDSHD